MMKPNRYRIFLLLTAAILMTLQFDATAQILIPQVKLMSPTISAARNVANDQLVFRCGYTKPGVDNYATTRFLVDNKVFTHQEIEQIDFNPNDIIDISMEKDSSNIAKYTSDGNIKRLLIITTKSRKSTYKKL